ncbi:FAD-dependent oxidoreductase [Enterococcus sp. CWB-B31]|uniref:FAD-dependent oxidoreductase n=1 Tax=Enterococcus sp. CWB-B31 TaxID=2885159 RepID=UPI001E4AD236|nr:FAD-dependent oxidoreductase [Enterococcus sp. CWB-B31]MCB5954484.1 FAD-dependent oxidoreductase [Enterococcus sp. CWB-B31]
MKIIIIGASHGGLQAAFTIKRLNPGTDVILIEKRNDISYVSSGITIKLNHMVDDLDDVRYTTAEDLHKLGIRLCLESKVTHIEPEGKIVMYEKPDGSQAEENYDKLILAMGSNQFSLNMKLPGNNQITHFKSYDSSLEALHKIEAANSISIIGGGYIGVELSDALKDKGKEVHLIESADTVLFRYIDKELGEILKKEIVESGIHLHLNETVLSFNAKEEEIFSTVTTKKEIKNDYVVIAVNARPDTELVHDFLDLNPNGTVRVNKHMQTSDPNIYALGDIVSYPVHNSYRQSFIPLVNNVVRSATVAAMNVMGNKMSFNTTKKTTATHVFGYYIASSGLTETEAMFEGIDVESIFLKLPYQLPYLKEQDSIYIKMVFSKETNCLIGGQLMSKKDVTQIINIISLAIDKEVDWEELVTMDFYFNPILNQPMGVISQAAYEFMLRKYKN